MTKPKPAKRKPRPKKEKGVLDKFVPTVYLALDVYCCNKQRFILQIGCYSEIRNCSEIRNRSFHVACTPPEAFRSADPAFQDAFHLRYDNDGKDIRFIKESGRAVDTQTFPKCLDQLADFLKQVYNDCDKRRITLAVYSYHELESLAQLASGSNFRHRIESIVNKFVVLEILKHDHHRQVFLPLDLQLGEQLTCYSSDNVVLKVKEAFLKSELGLLKGTTPQQRLFNKISAPKGLHRLPQTQIGLSHVLHHHHLRLNSIQTDIHKLETTNQIIRAAKAGKAMICAVEYKPSTPVISPTDGTLFPRPALLVSTAKPLSCDPNTDVKIADVPTLPTRDVPNAVSKTTGGKLANLYAEALPKVSSVVKKEANIEVTEFENVANKIRDAKQASKELYYGSQIKRECSPERFRSKEETKKEKSRVIQKFSCSKEKAFSCPATLKKFLPHISPKEHMEYTGDSVTVKSVDVKYKRPFISCVPMERLTGKGQHLEKGENALAIADKPTTITNKRTMPSKSLKEKLKEADAEIAKYSEMLLQLRAKKRKMEN